ncbi:heavy-metal-associated domain-containing protein [Lachnospiraceae bacterium MD1]|jgi:copper chaperone CopZ|uniref:Heavy-metal-associated domain-containing protein n=1 Tax=Variimorphobacter saccharofermentans TaxID=2755051 RepID=A0A839JXY1_9FIRM|nr:heavy metal-associated domain-containing protein [Variimorphobacter saccharofermentans]MBB2182077.1 heavy-metal-associated domain-containing protein [Variimorphobacter saccharofermentans]
MNQVHYNVSGLINNPVKTQVKNVLEEIDGVQKVNIDLGRSTVEVHYNDPADDCSIRNAIEHVGCKVND